MTTGFHAIHVPGQDLPWPFPLVLLLVATTTAGAAVGEWRAPSRNAPQGVARAPDAPRPREPSAVAPTASASAGPPITSASASDPAADAPARCAPLRIQFARAAASPSAAAAVPLRALAAWLIAHPDATAVLDGHADAVGSEQKNLALSRSRAERVATILVTHGVPRARLTARGFGAFAPVAQEDDASAENRRVVVHVRSVRGCPLATEEIVEP